MCIRDRTHRIEARCGDDVAGERYVVVGRIEDVDQSAVVIKALREVTHPLQRRGRVDILGAAGYELAGILLGPEEEEPLLVGVPMLGDVHGTADAVRLDVVPVRRPGSSRAILDGVV